jgi:proteasome lid subunit RPN8/RPN11
MSFSIPATIRAHVASLLAPDHRLSCASSLWRSGLAELRRRGGGQRESGAFLLGVRNGSDADMRRRVMRVVYYDDLDPHCLDTGVVIFQALGFGPLWQLCRETGLSVVADVHTHPGEARQSDADRRHPMIATAGHIAIIVPDFAQRLVHGDKLGLYEYVGAHQWRDHSGGAGSPFFYAGMWG